jgi:hypothetical protein
MPAMTDRGLLSENPVIPGNDPAPDAPKNGPDALEQRVQRLEDAVALLQDTKRLEERIADRLAKRSKRGEPSPGATGGLIVDAGQKLLPAALNLIRTHTDQAAPQEGQPSPSPPRSWLLFDAYAEARAMVRMYFDPRYRPTLQAKVLPPVLFLAILTSWFWVPGTSITLIVMKVVDVLMAFLAFKVLSREVRRYRDLVQDIFVIPRP